jgi:nitrogenase subunit NifH
LINLSCSIPQDCTPIYPQNGGTILAAETGLKLLSKIPIDPNLVRCGESGENFIQKFNESDTAKVFQELQSKLLEKMKSVNQ